MIQQKDLYGNIIDNSTGAKDSDAMRSYFLKSRTYTIVDIMKMKTGLPKCECISESLEIVNKLMNIIGDFEEINNIFNNPLIEKLIKFITDNKINFKKCEELIHSQEVELVLDNIDKKGVH